MPLTLAGVGTVSGLNVPAPGLVLIRKESFTAVSSKSLDGVFTSLYKNYRVVILPSAVSMADDDISMRLRVGGVDNSTTSSYVRQHVMGNSSTASSASTVAALLKIGAATSADAAYAAMDMDIYNPMQAVPTRMYGRGSNRSSGVNYFQHWWGTHNQSVAYDGFTFFPASGTISGDVYVYGYNETVGDATAYDTPPAPALTLMASQSFSAASTVNVNNCFSADYENYKVAINITAASTADVGILMRMRAGGVDNSGATSYFRQQLNALATGYAAVAQNTSSWGLLAVTSANPYTGISLEVDSPFASAFTSARLVNGQWISTGDKYLLVNTYWHNVASSFDGFSLTTSTGNVTGTLSVYGYAKAA